MKTTIYPSKNKVVELEVPSSKSLMHRALICASFARGSSKIKEFTLNDDVMATINCLEKLGSLIKKHDDEILIQGIEKPLILENDFYPNESGSTLRFLLPFLALSNQEVTIHFAGLLGIRPLDTFQTIFEENGVQWRKNSNSLVIKGPLKQNIFSLKGNVSSQFISGLLMMIPLTNKGGKVVVEKPFESSSYVKLTIDVMKKFGVIVHETEVNEKIVYEIDKNQNYQSSTYVVEKDFSQAANFLALGIINQPVILSNLNIDSFQGDKVIIDYLKKIGGFVTVQEKKVIVKKPDVLKETEVDLADSPDLGPILMMVASLIPGNTHFLNTHRLFIKESNRAFAMEEELAKIGASITVNDNDILVTGIKNLPNGQNFDSHNDHRICMSLAILATVLKSPSVINGSNSINKSYSSFFDDLIKLGVEVKHE